MRFDRLHLQNFKCHEQVDLSLSTGVTVIHGLNGSGKSSLLEACFFALYGAKALDQTLEEIVTIGAEETIVELWFTHAGESYHLRRRIRVSSGDARTAECVLEGPDHTTEGARDVRERVASLLRMDTDAFVNCAYVRQGEVNKLINASPSVRQDMLDDLLQLGKLEDYRERASDARVGVGRVRDDKRGALSEIEEQIEAKDQDSLHDRQNELESKLAEVSENIERYEQNRDEAEETLDEAETVIEEYVEKREELDDIEADIDDLRERIQETEREREALSESLTETQEALTDAREQREGLLDSVSVDQDGDEPLGVRVQQRIEAVEAAIDDLTEEITELSVEKQEHDSDAEQHRERADELAESAAEKREQADELEAERSEMRDLLAEKREQIEEMEAEIETKRADFEDSPVEFGEATSYRENREAELGDLREQRAECEADLKNVREQLTEAEELRDAGKCPECGQPVEGSPHVDAISEYEAEIETLEADLESLDEQESELEERLERARELETLEATVEELETNRENLAQLLDQREQTIEDKTERIEHLRAEADDHEETASEKREQAQRADEQASECQQAIAERNQEKQEYKQNLDTLESLADVLDEIATLEDDVETLRTQREEKAEVNEERREVLGEKRERRDELQASFDEGRIDQARKQREKAANYLEEVEAELESLAETQADLQGELGAVENELETLADLRARRDALEATVENLESLYTEAEQLEEMYGTLKSELRRRNIESLERMLNETFELVYKNDTYARIEIDGEYRLTVYQKDGEPLDPQQLSGGERALFNLSLRCAIYQLLAEGIEGAAPMPPLILDEPTVFLDDGHVSQLVELVEAMRDLGVEQILVVSHDEELVAAADDLVTVRKDPTTNRSTVEHADTVDQRLLAGADD